VFCLSREITHFPNSVHSNLVAFFIRAIIGLVLFPKLDMNLEREVSCLTNLCTSFIFFGLHISIKALRLSKFATIPRLVNMKPKILPLSASKTHLLRFSACYTF